MIFKPKGSVRKNLKGVQAYLKNILWCFLVIFLLSVVSISRKLLKRLTPKNASSIQIIKLKRKFIFNSSVNTLKIFFTEIDNCISDWRQLSNSNYLCNSSFLSWFHCLYRFFCFSVKSVLTLFSRSRHTLNKLSSRSSSTALAELTESFSSSFSARASRTDWATSPEARSSITRLWFPNRKLPRIFKDLKKQSLEPLYCGYRDQCLIFYWSLNKFNL